MSTLKPKIYVACLAAYNNGKLHGKWIDANQDIDVVREEINEMLAKSPEANSEEYAIHDYEDFCGIAINEYENIETVVDLAKFVSEHGKLGAEILLHVDKDIDNANQLLEENYIGEYASKEDFAQSLFEECYEIPEYLAYYIDYEKVARDLFLCDYFHIDINDKIHVFSNA